MTQEQNQINPLDFRKLQLKVKALTESSGELSGINAEYRAEITMLTEYCQDLEKEVQRLTEEAARQATEANDVVEDQAPAATDPTS